MTTQQQLAREYYFAGNMTQKEIAHAVGVDEKTLYRWIKKEAWDKLKRAAQTMPAIISDNFCSQLVEMQNHVASREEGKRFPTIQEAETMRKLVLCITRMKDTPSLGTNIEMMIAFSTYVSYADHELSRKMSTYADAYFKSKARLGAMPYQFAYGAPSPRPSAEDLNDISEELNDLKENLRTCETTSAKECVTTKEENPKDKVTQADVTSNKVEAGTATQPAESHQAHNESKSGIESTPGLQTQSHTATQQKMLQETPCPTPGIIGHFPGTEPTGTTANLTQIIPGAKALLPYGIIWLGADQVYDPGINMNREIKNGELDWLYRNGYIDR